MKKIKLLVGAALCTIMATSMCPFNAYAKTVDDDFDDMIDEVEDRLDDFTPSNDLTKSDLTKVIKKIVDTDDYKISYEDFEVVKSTVDDKGYVTCTIIIEEKDNDNDDDDDDGDREEIDFDKSIPRISEDEEEVEYSGSDKSGKSADSPNKIVVDKISKLVDSKFGFKSTSSTVTIGDSAMTEIFDDGNFIGAVVKGNKGTSFPLKVQGTKFTTAYTYIPEVDKFLKVNISKDIFVQNESINIMNDLGDKIYYLTNTALPSKEVTSAGWYEKDGKTYYINSTGIQEGWVQNNGSWYYLDNATKTKKTDCWLVTNGKKYHLDLVGKMEEGWQQIDNIWYYFVPKNGNMATGLTKVDKTYYYFNPDGTMYTGWIKCTDGKWRYFDYDGRMAVDRVINGYKVDKNGVWQQKTK